MEAERTAAAVMDRPKRVALCIEVADAWREVGEDGRAASLLLRAIPARLAGVAGEARRGALKRLEAVQPGAPAEAHAAGAGLTGQRSLANGSGMHDRPGTPRQPVWDAERCKKEA